MAAEVVAVAAGGRPESASMAGVRWQDATAEAPAATPASPPAFDSPPGSPGSAATPASPHSPADPPAASDSPPSPATSQIIAAEPSVAEAEGAESDPELTLDEIEAALRAENAAMREKQARYRARYMRASQREAQCMERVRIDPMRRLIAAQLTESSALLSKSMEKERAAATAGDRQRLEHGVGARRAADAAALLDRCEALAFEIEASESRAGDAEHCVATRTMMLRRLEGQIEADGKRIGDVQRLVAECEMEIARRAYRAPAEHSDGPPRFAMNTSASSAPTLAACWRRARPRGPSSKQSAYISSHSCSQSRSGESKSSAAAAGMAPAAAATSACAAERRTRAARAAQPSVRTISTEGKCRGDILRAAQCSAPASAAAPCKPPPPWLRSARQPLA